MNGNLGLHIIRNPSGTYSYVGTVPGALGTVVIATAADIRAGRAWEAHGRAVTIKFPTFPTRQAAVAHAAALGITTR